MNHSKLLVFITGFGSVLQSAYLFHRSSTLATYSLVLLLAAILFSSHSWMLKNWSRLMHGRPIFPIFLIATIGYCALRLLLSSNSASLEIIQNPIFLYILIVALVYLVYNVERSAFVDAVLVFSLIASLAPHIFNFYINFDVSNIGTGRSTSRYGFFVEGASWGTSRFNVVNTTAFNLSLVATSAYIYGRCRSKQIILSGAMIALAISTIPIILATGTRSALFLTIAILILVEVRLLGSRRVLLLAFGGLLLAALWELPNVSESALGVYVAERWGGLFGNSGESGRALSLSFALQSEWQFLFGHAATPVQILNDASDNFPAFMIISFGVAGLALVILTFVTFFKYATTKSKIDFYGCVLLALPLVIRSLNEDTFLPRTGIFPYLMFCAVVIFSIFSNLQNRNKTHSSSKTVGFAYSNESTTSRDTPRSIPQ